MQRLSTILMVAAGLGLAASAHSAQTRSFQPLVTAGTHDIASGGEFVGSTTAVVWVDRSDESIWIRTSDGRGVDWATAVRVDAGTSEPKEAPHVVIAGTSVFVAWRDYRHDPDTNPDDADVYYQLSTDGGATWQAQDTLLDKGLPSGDQNHAVALELRANGGVLAALMTVENDATGQAEAFLNYSKDDGLTFLGSALSVGPRAHPEVLEAEFESTVSESLAPLAFVARDPSSQTEGVFFSLFDFVSEAFLVRDSMGSQAGAGQIDTFSELRVDFHERQGGHYTQMAWSTTRYAGTPTAHQNFSDDSGATWKRPLALASNAPVGNVPSTGASQGGASSVITPTGAVGGAPPRLIAVWHDDRSGTNEVFTSYSDDHGASWSPDLQLSTGGAENAIVPHWRCFDDGTYIAFEQGGTGLTMIIVMTSTGNHGATWEPPVPMTPDLPIGSTLLSGSIASEYENLVAFWRADTDGDGDQELYTGGRRQAYLVPSATSVVAGVDRLQFDGFGFRPEDEGATFGVLVSAGTGGFVAPDGRATGLADDHILAGSIAAIQSGQLAGTIAGGQASTPFVDPVPSLPPMTLHCVGVSFALPGPTIGSLTDIVLVDVQ